MRCLSLAQAWQDAGGHGVFVVRESPEWLITRLSSERMDVVRIDCDASSLGDASSVIQIASQFNTSRVVVDGERFTSDYLAILNKSGISVALYDDFASRPSFPVEIVVNPNLGARQEPYRQAGYQGLLLSGGAYVPLRREFFSQPCGRVFADIGNRVLVSLGGSDPENLAPRIIGALVRNPSLQLTVVSGPAYLHDIDLAVFRECVDVVTGAEDILSHMMSADIAVVAAGGTLWEALFSRCAVLSYSRNSVQACVVACLAETGAVVDLGDVGLFDASVLRTTVERLASSRLLREQMAKRGIEFADGRGAGRVAAFLAEGKRHG